MAAKKKKKPKKRRRSSEATEELRGETNASENAPVGKAAPAPLEEVVAAKSRAREDTPDPGRDSGDDEIDAGDDEQRDNAYESDREEEPDREERQDDDDDEPVAASPKSEPRKGRGQPTGMKVPDPGAEGTVSQVGGLVMVGVIFGLIGLAIVVQLIIGG